MDHLPLHAEDTAWRHHAYLCYGTCGFRCARARWPPWLLLRLHFSSSELRFWALVLRRLRRLVLYSSLITATAIYRVHGCVAPFFVLRTRICRAKFLAHYNCWPTATRDSWRCAACANRFAPCGIAAARVACAFFGAVWAGVGRDLDHPATPHSLRLRLKFYPVPYVGSGASRHSGGSARGQDGMPHTPSGGSVTSGWWTGPDWFGWCWMTVGGRLPAEPSSPRNVGTTLT